MADLFNIESSEDTRELEESLRSQSVGSTLYDRRWILNAVMTNCSAEATFDAELESSLKGLADAAAERDVCAFLIESQCLDLLLESTTRDTSCDRARDLAMCLMTHVLTLCGEDDVVANRIDHYSAVAINSFFATEEQTAMASHFAVFKSIYQCLSSQFELSSELIGSAQKANGFFTGDEVVQRVGFVLASATSDVLLAKVARFVFALVDLNLESDEDVLLESAYSSSQFLAVLVEALKQSGDGDATFVLLEVLGQLSSPENLAPVASSVCDVVARLLTERGQVEDSLGSGDFVKILPMAANLCYTAWHSVCHMESFEALRTVGEVYSDDSSSESTSVKDCVMRCVAFFQKKYHDQTEVSK